MKTQTRDDVLYGFAVEYDGSQVVLNRYRVQFPKHAEDLTRLASEIEKPISDRPLADGEKDRANAAVRRFLDGLAKARAE